MTYEPQPMVETNEETTRKAAAIESTIDMIAQSSAKILNTHTLEFERQIMQYIAEQGLADRWGYRIDPMPVSPRTHQTYHSVEDIGSQDDEQKTRSTTHPVPNSAADWVIEHWGEYIGTTNKVKDNVCSQHDNLFERLLNEINVVPIYKCGEMTPHVRLFVVDPALPNLVKQDLDLRKPLTPSFETSFIRKDGDIGELMRSLKDSPSLKGWDAYVARHCSTRVGAEDIVSRVYQIMLGKYLAHIQQKSMAPYGEATVMICKCASAAAWITGNITESEIDELMHELMQMNKDGK